MCGILESRNRLYILWLNIQRILAISLLIKYHYISAPNLHNSLSIGSEEYFRHVKDCELLWPLEYVLVHHHDHLPSPIPNQNIARQLATTTAAAFVKAAPWRRVFLSDSDGRWFQRVGRIRQLDTASVHKSKRALLSAWLCFIISLWIHDGPWFRTRVPGYRSRLVLD